MRNYTAHILIILWFLFLSLSVAKTVSAYYPIECASGQYYNGDCDGSLIKYPTSCPPGTTGADCCTKIASDLNQLNPGLNLRASCTQGVESFCAVGGGPWLPGSQPPPNTALVCSYDQYGTCGYSSCKGRPVFCCAYTTPTPTPTPTPIPPTPTPCAGCGPTPTPTPGSTTTPK